MAILSGYRHEVHWSAEPIFGISVDYLGEPHLFLDITWETFYSGASMEKGKLVVAVPTDLEALERSKFVSLVVNARLSVV